MYWYSLNRTPFQCHTSFKEKESYAAHCAKFHQSSGDEPAGDPLFPFGKSPVSCCEGACDTNIDLSVTSQLLALQQEEGGDVTSDLLGLDGEEGLGGSGEGTEGGEVS